MNNNKMIYRAVVLLFFSFVLLIAGCNGSQNSESLTISGQTMGTTYTVVVLDDGNLLESEALRVEIETVLNDVNARMSNWDENSEISRFNTRTDTTPVKISRELARVMAAANEVHSKSAGKFDVTLGPLIELWGFGPRKPDDPLPPANAIAAMRERVGQAELIRLDLPDAMMAKLRSDVSIDLSAIAKGYGIDAIVSKLMELGYKNHLVEIGGDLRATGINTRSVPWRVGIENPQTGAREIKRIVALNDQSLATSGDYRNYVEVDGVRYSHIIDPSTGRPITHRTTSVSVVARDAMTADAWATALLVLGEEKGLETADTYGIAAYFISRTVVESGSGFVIRTSSKFDQIFAVQQDR